MELELFPLEKDKETASVWDNYVPIAKLWKLGATNE